MKTFKKLQSLTYAMFFSYDNKFQFVQNESQCFKTGEKHIEERGELNIYIKIFTLLFSLLILVLLPIMWLLSLLD